MQNDVLQAQRNYPVKSLSGKIKRFLTNKFLSKILHAKATGSGLLRFAPLPQAFTDYINDLAKYDAVIQVGGSFFVDMYGVSQFDNALCTLIAGKPLLMLGHSVGPFNNDLFRSISRTVFANCHQLGLREEVSLQLLRQESLPLDKLAMGTDTAWSVKPLPPANMAQYGNGPFIAITTRVLHPFDSRLGISQQDYEQAFATLCDQLNANGFHILALSTCTGIDGYPKDDRMVAQRIKHACKNPQKITVVMDELNDLELGQLLGSCVLTIGTRLHSAIISMNFGTPAFALNYEHKSQGIMENLDLPELAHPVHSLIDGSLLVAVTDALKNIDELNSKVKDAVTNERTRSEQFIVNALNTIKKS